MGQWRAGSHRRGGRLRPIGAVVAVAAALVVVPGTPATAATGAISGIVTAADSGLPREGLCVRAYPAPSGSFAGAATTDAAGAYTITGLDPRNAGTGAGEGYFVQVSERDCSNVETADGLGYHAVHYGDVYERNDSTVVEVGDGTTTSGIDLALGVAVSIAGTVVATDTGLPLACTNVTFVRSGTNPLATASPSDGSYEHDALPPDTYKVRFRDCGGDGYSDEWWEEVTAALFATEIVLAAGESATGVDGTLTPGGSISGSVTETGSGTPIEGLCVRAFGDTTLQSSSTTTDAAGAWTLDELPLDTWDVQFNCAGVQQDPAWSTEWYDEKPDRPSADPVAGSDTTPVTGIDATLDGVTLAAQVGAMEFLPITPCAVFDTRSATGDLAGPLDPGETRTFDLTGAIPSSQGGGACGAPSAASDAVELNLVALDPTGGGNLRIAASGTVPEGGVVNFVTGANNSSALTVEVDASGRVDVTANGGPVHVRGVALGGYQDTDAAGLEFVPLPPCAVFDTRSATGDFDGPRAGGSITTFAVAGTIPASQGGSACTAPPDTAAGVVINLVALDAAGGGNLRIAPAGTAPSGGVVNYDTSGGNSNALSVEVASDAVDVEVNGAALDVRGVVVGYYTATEGGGQEFVPTTPCAVFDTRNGTGEFDGALSALESVTAQLVGTIPVGQGGAGCDGPDERATTVSLNLVAVNPTGSGNLRASESGVPPSGGVVNMALGRTNSNEIPLGLDVDGEVDVVVNGGPTDVRGVTLGFWVPGD